MSLYENNAKYGKRAIGKKALEKHLKGIRLTQKKAIHARCYDCSGGYDDGRYTCNIQECPLFSYMPYKHVAPPEM